ncbi:MAG: hypothetical protein ACLFUH_07470 [Bacteroidales bacterium]
MLSIGIVTGFGLFGLIFAYMSVNESEDSPLKWLFLFGTMIFILVDSFIMYQVAMNAGTSGIANTVSYGGLYFSIIVIIMTLLVFLIRFFHSLFEKIEVRKKKYA